MALLNRTLSLRAAHNMNGFGAGNGGPGSFEALLRQSIDGVDPADLKIEVGGLLVETRHYEFLDSGLLLHLVSSVPDDQVPVVPNEPGVELQLADAPEATEFVDGEMMLLVRGDNVLMCKCGLAEKAMLNYVEAAAEKVNISRDYSRCLLGKRVDLDKVAMVQQEGVKAVRFNGVASAVAAEHLERVSSRERVMGRVLDELRQLLGFDDVIPEDAENLKVEVSFAFNRREALVMAQNPLVELAEAAIGEDEEGFVIETLAGQKIRAGDILLTKAISLPAFGKTVRHQDAWARLSEFADELWAPGDE